MPITSTATTTTPTTSTATTTTLTTSTGVIRTPTIGPTTLTAATLRPTSTRSTISLNSGIKAIWQSNVLIRGIRVSNARAHSRTSTSRIGPASISSQTGQPLTKTSSVPTSMKISGNQNVATA